jgi:thioredoxin-related protein
MMKKYLWYLVISLPSLCAAQNSPSENNHGIKWATGLTWEQIKQRAKQEKKYIFIDAYTTWCGPCKLMDKNVYTNDTVGDYFNDRFISVKVQMDHTSKDNEFIKSWYDDAVALGKLYRVDGYPSFIFLNPQGEIVHKGMGYQQVKAFLSISQTAIIPGKIYEDKYADYDNLAAEYKQGIRKYEKMPYMIITAYKFGDNDFGKQLLQEHTAYVKNLTSKERYSKENIQMWSSFLLKSGSDLFNFFYKDGAVIDKVMNRTGYARSVVDKTVQKEVVDSFFKMQKGETTLSVGKKVSNGELMKMGNLPVRLDGKIVSDGTEADWKKLYQMIRKDFDIKTTKRNVLQARINWYKKHDNYVALTKYTLLLYRKYPPNLTPANAYNMNDLAWKVFCYVPSSEKKLITSMMKWTKKAIGLAPIYTLMIDTYANLLYKIGRRKEAIMWEEKAVNVAEKENAALIAKGLPPLPKGWTPEDYILVVEQMKKGEKTYLKEGAMWN